MKALALIFAFLGIFSIDSFAQDYTFVENHGQWPNEVLYRADIPGGFVWVKKDGLRFAFSSPPEGHKHGATHLQSSKMAPSKETETQVVDLKFLGTSPTPSPYHSMDVGTKYNFYIGNDPSLWATNVPGYKEVTIQNIYKNIDLRLYTKSQKLKYDLIVRPGGSPNSIKFIYDGARDVLKRGNYIEIGTKTARLSDGNIYVYQMSPGNKKTTIACTLQETNGIFSYQIDKEIDGQSTLVIDPEIIFSTFSGSYSDNWGFTATFGENGSLYSGGIVNGPGFPSTTGPVQDNWSGDWDIGILKYDSLGQKLLYATYLGGKNVDIPASIIMNSKEQLVITGITSSPNFPVTSDAVQQNFKGDKNYNSNNQLLVGQFGINFIEGTDQFVSVLDKDGAKLIGSTLIGGTQNDGLRLPSSPLTINYGDFVRGEVYLDASDNIWVANTTSSTDFPLKNPTQSIYGGGLSDGILFKLNPTCSELLFSTYAGGTGEDVLTGIRLFKDGGVIACGGTNSPDIEKKIVSNGPETGIDGLLVSVKHGSGTLLATGQTGFDMDFLIDLDNNDNVYLFGQCDPNFPIIGNVYSNPGSRQFIQKLNPGLDSTHFSTLIGSGENKTDFIPTAFLVNECGNIFISGWSGGISNLTYSTGNTFHLPITKNTFQSTTDGSDFYLAVYQKDMGQLFYATYFGGYGSNDHVDGGTSRFDKRGIIYHSVCAGCQGSSEFPTTPGAWSQTNNSFNCNNAAFKFDLATLKADFNTYSKMFDSVGLKNGCTPFDILFINESSGGNNFFWDFGNGQTSTKKDSIPITYHNTGKFPVRLIANDINTCIKSDTAIGYITVSKGHFSAMANDDSICQSTPALLQAYGGGEYKWYIGDKIVGTGPNVELPLNESSRILLKAIDNHGCIFLDTFDINVDYYIQADFNPLSKGFVSPHALVGCAPLDVTFYNHSRIGTTYHWDFGNGNTSTSADASVPQTYLDTGTYQVELIAFGTSKCNTSDTIRKQIIVHGPEFSASAPDRICEYTPVILTATGGSVYNWYLGDSLISHNNETMTQLNASSVIYFSSMNQFGCNYKDTFYIQVDKNIEANFEYVLLSPCSGLPEFKFKNHTDTTMGKTTWFVNNKLWSHEYHPLLEINEEGEYFIQLKSTNGLCENSKSFEFTAIPTFIPNVITPNNDGKNDTFVIQSFNKKSINIFDRWGGDTFSSDDYMNDWEGENDKSGIYYYIIKFDRANSTCKGWVQVLK